MSGGVSGVEGHGSHMWRQGHTLLPRGGLCQLSVVMSFRLSPGAQNEQLPFSLCLIRHMLASKTLVEEKVHVIKEIKDHYEKAVVL